MVGTQSAGASFKAGTYFLDAQIKRGNEVTYNEYSLSSMTKAAVLMLVKVLTTSISMICWRRVGDLEATTKAKPGGQWLGDLANAEEPMVEQLAVGK